MKKQFPQPGNVPSEHTTEDADFRASEENPVDETMEEQVAENDRAGFDNNPETSGKPIVPDEPVTNPPVADPAIDPGSISDYIPGEESDTPNENQRTVAARQFGGEEDDSKSTGYKDYIHPSAHNSVTGSPKKGDQESSDENPSSDAP